MPLTAQQLRQFAEEGYLFLPGCFAEEEVSILRDEAEQIYAKRCPAPWRSLPNYDVRRSGRSPQVGPRPNGPCSPSMKTKSKSSFPRMSITQGRGGKVVAVNPEIEAVYGCSCCSRGLTSSKSITPFQ